MKQRSFSFATWCQCSLLLVAAVSSTGCQNSRNDNPTFIGNHDRFSKMKSMPLSETPSFVRQQKAPGVPKGQDPFLAMGGQSAFDQQAAQHQQVGYQQQMAQASVSQVATAKVSPQNPNVFAQPRPNTSHNWAPQPKRNSVQAASATMAGPQPFPEDTGNPFAPQATTAQQEEREGFQQPILHADHNSESFYHPQPQSGVGRAKVGL